MIRRLALPVLSAVAASVMWAGAALAADPVLTYEERVFGDPDAPVEIIEYSSLLCPHCADFHERVFPELKEKYIDTGKVRLVFRDHTLGSQLALGAEMILRCAPEEVFPALQATLFKNQREWGGAENPLKALQGYAALAGMDENAVTACLDSQSIFDGILENEKKAQTYGINSTPSFVINGELAVVGAQSLEAFAAVIDPLLNK